MIKVLRSLLLLTVIFAATACSRVPVAEGLTQKQANQIVAVLGENGISAVATKESGGKSRYKVTVEERNYSHAVALLNRKGLPQDPRPTFSELVEQRGLIPNSREVEKLRVQHLKAVQLEELLENYPGIVSARVVLGEASEEAKVPGVSVVIQKRSENAVSDEEIAKMIASSLGLSSPEDVIVSSHVVPDEDSAGEVVGAEYKDGRVVRVPLVPFLFRWRVPEDDYNGIVAALIGFVIVLTLAGGVVGYWYGYYQQSRQIFEDKLPEIGVGEGTKESNRRNLLEG
ncbi:MAG: hypothetical protein D6719_06120 [Candidatus Dadabacteria bacterium]|nr:MAG: hypothetical protein D6719_06120 [Candidatus Dadabacteria bacterium]